MPKFPEPPAAAVLAAIGPDVRTLPAMTRLWRIYFRGGPHPVHWSTFRSFGPTGSRFDHHLLPRAVQDRQILYASDHGETPFAEVFQDTRVIDLRRDRPWLTAFDLDAAVTLLDLTGDWPTRAGASAAINSGPRPRARRWSQCIYDAFPDIEGLWYPSSMGGGQPAVALYERAIHVMPARPAFNRPLNDPAIYSIAVRAAGRFGYRVV